MSALAWMVADGILEFQLALPRNKLERGDFHDKFGIFADTEGHQISFNGSYNDSIQGTRNYESIKIFCSWEPHFAPLVRSDVNRFEHLWNNMDPNVRVFGMLEAAREQILQRNSQKFHRSKSPALATHRCNLRTYVERYVERSERLNRPLAPTSRWNHLWHHRPCNNHLPRIKALGRWLHKRKGRGYYAPALRTRT